MKTQALQPVEQKGVVRAEDRHPAVEHGETREVKVIEMAMRYDNALQCG
jgi:predicted RNA-binding protein with TRAM domain